LRRRREGRGRKERKGERGRERDEGKDGKGYPLNRNPG